MEHVPDPHGARRRAVAALARARWHRHAAGPLRERLRGTLERCAAIWTKLRARWARELERIGAAMRRARELRRGHGRVRVASARDAAGAREPSTADLARARVVWRDPVTPTAADRVRVPRLCDPADHRARGGPPVYPDPPRPNVGIRDEWSPESGPRRMSTHPIDIHQSHRATHPDLDPRQLARVNDDIQATLRRINEGHQ